MKLQKHAFTLIEILVTLAILAVIAALVFPVLLSARTSAKKDVCLSNLHQLGTAISLYAHDYDDYMPFAPDCNTKALALKGGSSDPDEALIRSLADVRSVLKPYGAVLELFRCPQDRNTLGDVDPLSGHKPTWFEEFGSSYHYNDQKGLRVSPLGSFASPAKGYLMGDYERFHADLVNVLFADFHVKTVSWTARSDAFAEKE